MSSRRKVIITTSVALSLFLTSSFAAAQTMYHGKTTTIENLVLGPVTGNSGGTDAITNLTDNNIVPQISNDTDVYKNGVIIENGGEVNNLPHGFVYGGITYGNGKVYENAATINNGGIVIGYVYGGYTDGDGDVYKNSVTINDGGYLKGRLFGAVSLGDGSVYENIVTINTGGKVQGLIVGGYSEGGGDVYKNHIIVYGGSTVLGSVCQNGLR